MKKILNILFLQCFIASVAFSADPVGQKADYKVDTNPKRTHSMIKSGKVKASVIAFHENTKPGPSYEISLNYVFNVTFLGQQAGEERRLLEKEFFSEEFIMNLRQKKHYEGAYFKADHLGYADAKNLDGKMYANCDKIFLYDIKEPPQFMLDVLTNAVDDKIEDLKALVHYYKGIPVLGGAKVDITGRSSGTSYKVGMDYVTP